ncbi:unnamed protein product [Caenorhabditis auriculariae]|uniref:Uncharacterized protein n=1 Tax=Caenorhabditis auriculariae TaxID=2777116 RepID=A0A8S1GVW2_9PELO|nr:unnamed protein product [Caenorhabditis auriculariae]
MVVLRDTIGHPAPPRSIAGGKMGPRLLASFTSSMFFAISAFCFVAACAEFAQADPRAMPYFKEDNRTATELSKALGASFPPCCSDSISSIACRRLQMSNPTKFLDRCKSDADFSLIQCCNTCGIESAADRYEVIFQQNERSAACFDRHSTDFCKRFLQKQDVWGKSQWSCDGQYANLAFRICRKTCNFCRGDIYRTPLGRFQPVSCGKPPVLMPN